MKTYDQLAAELQRVPSARTVIDLLRVMERAVPLLFADTRVEKLSPEARCLVTRLLCRLASALQKEAAQLERKHAVVTNHLNKDAT